MQLGFDAFFRQRETEAQTVLHRHGVVGERMPEEGGRELRTYVAENVVLIFVFFLQIPYLFFLTYSFRLHLHILNIF